MQRTKQELIDIIKDKQANARNEYLIALGKLNEPTIRSVAENIKLQTKRDKNKAYMEAYIDIIALLESTEIIEPNICDTCVETRNLCDTYNASRDKYGLCMWIKGAGIKASQCGHYCKPKDTWKAEALGVNEPTCEKSANGGVKEDLIIETTERIVGSPTPYFVKGRYVRENDKEIEIATFDGGHAIVKKDTIKDIRKISKLEEQEAPKNEQFREFVDSLDNQTYFVNAKNVIGLSIEKQRNKYYINIYVGQMVVLEFETEQEQLDKYQELKEWLRKWN